MLEILAAAGLVIWLASGLYRRRGRRKRERDELREMLRAVERSIARERERRNG
jgi:hypothetical protein